MPNMRWVPPTTGGRNERLLIDVYHHRHGPKWDDEKYAFTIARVPRYDVAPNGAGYRYVMFDGRRYAIHEKDYRMNLVITVFDTMTHAEFQNRHSDKPYLGVGARVAVIPVGAGTDSGRKGIVIPWSEIPRNGRGIPEIGDGSYYSVAEYIARGHVAIREFETDKLFHMQVNYLHTIECK